MEPKLKELIARAETGDHSAVPALREFMDSSPAAFDEMGDLALQAENALLEVAELFLTRSGTFADGTPPSGGSCRRSMTDHRRNVDLN